MRQIHHCNLSIKILKGSLLTCLVVLIGFLSDKPTHAAVTCDGPYQTSSELRRNFSGATMFGIATKTGKKWAEYLSKDGITIFMNARGKFTKGKWKIRGGQLCFSYVGDTYRCKRVTRDSCGQSRAKYAFVIGSDEGDTLTSTVHNIDAGDRMKMRVGYLAQEARKKRDTSRVAKRRRRPTSQKIIRTKAFSMTRRGRYLSFPSCKIIFPKSFLSNRRFFKKPIKISDIEFARSSWRKCTDNGKLTLGFILKERYGRSLGLKNSKIRITIGGDVKSLRFNGKIGYEIKTQSSNGNYFSVSKYSETPKIYGPGLPTENSSGTIYAVNGLFVPTRAEYANAKSKNSSPLVDRFDFNLKLIAEDRGKVEHLTKGRSFESISGSAKTFLAYNIKPADGHKNQLKSAKYKIVIGVDIKHTFDITVWNIGTSEIEETKDELVVVLKKNNGYSTSGKMPLTQVTALLKGRLLVASVKKKLKKSEPAIYVKSIRAY